MFTCTVFITILIVYFRVLSLGMITIHHVKSYYPNSIKGRPFEHCSHEQIDKYTTCIFTYTAYWFNMYICIYQYNIKNHHIYTYIHLYNVIHTWYPPRTFNSKTGGAAGASVASHVAAGSACGAPRARRRTGGTGGRLAPAQWCSWGMW